LQLIPLSKIVLSANIRFLRDSGIKQLEKSILAFDFAFTSRLTVSGPYDDGIYHLIDGAHRWTAVKRLSKYDDNKLKEKYTNYMFKCHVLPQMKRDQEMSIAFGNKII
jgi:hypothetical protein